MSQHDYVIDNGGGSAVRADINSALAAILSQNSGANAPATTLAYMPWYDTTAGILKIRNSTNTAWIEAVLPDRANTFSSSQRGSITVDNDLSFNMDAGNNFSCTTSGSGTLTFTNITAGQSGFILLVNASNHTISAHTNTKINAADLSQISQTGTYLLSYFSNGTNVFVAASRNVA